MSKWRSVSSISHALKTEFFSFYQTGQIYHTLWCVPMVFFFMAGLSMEAFDSAALVPLYDSFFRLILELYNLVSLLLPFFCTSF